MSVERSSFAGLAFASWTTSHGSLDAWADRAAESSTDRFSRATNARAPLRRLAVLMDRVRAACRISRVQVVES